MIKRLKALTATALVCLLASCIMAEQVYNPIPTPTTHTETTPLRTIAPEPVVTPKTEAQIAAELEAELQKSIRDNMSFDMAGLLPIGDGGERLIITLENSDQSQWMLHIRDEVCGKIKAAVVQAEQNCSAGTAVSFSSQFTQPSWQYLYILLLYNWEDTEAYNEAIKDNLSVQVSVKSTNGQMQAAVSVVPVYYRDAIRSFTGDDVGTYLGAEMVFAYMSTVFSENIEEQEYVLPPAEGNLAAGITWPLQGFTNLRKSWYAERDDGARKHTGTDIWAPEDTEIYSCTEGTVFHVGASLKGGNTVVIMDDYGFLFCYNHMVRLTDFLKKGQRVEAGQLIGHVGNTGNSACNHLHITIITPDGVLIDPYTYLLEVMPD